MVRLQVGVVKVAPPSAVAVIVNWYVDFRFIRLAITDITDVPAAFRFE